MHALALPIFAGGIFSGARLNVSSETSAVAQNLVSKFNLLQQSFSETALLLAGNGKAIPLRSLAICVLIFTQIMT